MKRALYLSVFFFIGIIGCAAAAACASMVVQFMGLKLTPCVLSALPLAIGTTAALNALKERAAHTASVRAAISIAVSAVPSAAAAVVLYAFLNRVEVSTQAFIFLVPFVFALFYTALFVAAGLTLCSLVEWSLCRKAIVREEL